MTPFGERMRVLRADRGMRLLDLAEGLGKSSAFLSALEHGRKGKPNDSLLDQIREVMQLSDKDFQGLVAAADRSGTTSRIPSGLSAQASETVNVFARKIKNLSPEQLERIRKVMEER